MPSDSQLLVRRYFVELVEKCDLQAADQLLTPDCAFFSQDLDVPLRGIQANRQLVALLHAMLSNIRIAILALSGIEDEVTASVSIHGVRQFSNEGVPLRWEEVTWTHRWKFRVANNQVAEIWCYGDFFDFLGPRMPPRQTSPVPS